MNFSRQTNTLDALLKAWERTDKYCKECRQTHTTLQPASTSGLDLNMPAGSGNTTLNKLLTIYFRAQMLPLDCDTPTCTNHNREPRANLQLARKLEAAPDLLCFRLLRFYQEWDREQGRAHHAKDFRRVSFPRELDMTRFVRSTYDPKTDAREDHPPNYSYSLYAVVTQRGVLDCGHYKAFVKVDGKWWELNDERWTKVTQAAATQSKGDEFTPYMLFYERAIRT